MLLRVNLPVAAFATLYTNPFTMLPLYLAAYQLGAWFIGVHNGAPMNHFTLPEMHWQSWPSDLWAWMLMLGKPLLIGLPLLALTLAITGYVAVRVAWRVVVMFRWRARKRRRAA